MSSQQFNATQYSKLQDKILKFKLRITGDVNIETDFTPKMIDYKLNSNYKNIHIPTNFFLSFDFLKNASENLNNIYTFLYDGKYKDLLEYAERTVKNPAQKRILEYKLKNSNIIRNNIKFIHNLIFVKDKSLILSQQNYYITESKLNTNTISYNNKTYIAYVNLTVSKNISTQTSGKNTNCATLLHNIKQDFRSITNKQQPISSEQSQPPVLFGTFLSKAVTPIPIMQPIYQYFSYGPGFYYGPQAGGKSNKNTIKCKKTSKYKLQRQKHRQVKMNKKHQKTSKLQLKIKSNRTKKRRH